MAPCDVAIVGAGFSGIAVAVQLLRRMPGEGRICMVNRGQRFGRGLAYGTNSDSHMLNVPAGRMGIDPADEGGFARYLAARGLPYKPSDFVPRNLYGEYLEDTLREAQQAAWPRLRLDMVSGGVVRLDAPAEAGAPFRLHLQEGGEPLQAAQVVLALGNFAPLAPRTASPCDWSGARLVGDPWDGRLARCAAPDEDVLLVGTGLTAYDVALQLLDRGHSGRIVMLSRRGLLPQPHRAQERPPAADLVPDDFLLNEASARACVHAVRGLIRWAEAQGHDWRDVIGGLRGHTPRLWQQLPAAGRRQFLRHLAPYWDTHRHRAAPQPAGRIAQALARGQLAALAGRLEDIRPGADGLPEARWLPRGGRQAQVQRFGAVINCTGPCSQLRHSTDPLMVQLLADGRISADPLGIGLRVGGGYRVAGADGRETEGLRYVGPLLKAQLWEATAVPELRLHAQAVTVALLERRRTFVMS
ncbi:MAG: FAD/NAD(P)-binding protein [Pseudomonadota bacterium]